MRPIFPALAGIFIMVAAVAPLASELSAILGGGHSQSTRMSAMQAGRPRVGLSTDSHIRVLDLCINVLGHPDIWESGEDAREAILSHCEAQAAHALTHSPADAYIWMIKASLALQRSNIPEVFIGLERSRQMAPYELWIAFRRASMDEQLEPLQSAQQRAGQDEDLLVLARSRRGTERLAARYLADQDFRERIVGLIETLPPTQQRRFVSNVRAISLGGT